MNKYELAVVVNAKIEDDARTATVEKVKEYITRYNGTITNVDEWGKKKLAYEIQKMSEGYYYFIQFEADAECPIELERHVRIMENVLRYLCVRQDRCCSGRPGIRREQECFPGSIRRRLSELSAFRSCSGQTGSECGIW